MIELLREQMNTVLGFGDGPAFARNEDVDACFVDNCGSCNGAGSTWRRKALACGRMLQSIRRLMFRELKPDQATFFNTDNSESMMHGLACGTGKNCFEHTQFYAVFGTCNAIHFHVHERQS